MEPKNATTLPTTAPASDEADPVAAGRGPLVLTLVLVGMLLGAFWLLTSVYWGDDRAHGAPAGPPPESAVLPPGDDPDAYPVPPPPFRNEDIREMVAETGKPCSGCHDEDLPPNPERRVLEMAHEEIVLRHDEEHRWCLDCHDAENRDKLRLASGALIDFSESHRLCGQCHGDKYRDWRAGIHGRRIGLWTGRKEYRLCVHCHWAHAPHFEPLAPLPPPTRPGAMR